LGRDQYAGCGTDRTSGAIGRGVTELHNYDSVHTGNSVRGNATYSTSATYQRTKPLLWGGVMYLSTQSLLLDSSLLHSNS
jgi:hypothetical protein